MNVHRSLEELRNELARAHVDDSAQQQHLNALKDEVDRVLDPEDDAHHSSLIDRINDMLVEFDHEHPGIAAALRTALNILGESGV